MPFHSSVTAAHGVSCFEKTQLTVCAGVVEDPGFTVAVAEVGDSSVNLVVRPFVKVADYWDVYFDVTEKMKLALDEAGISIPFPQRDVHLIKADA